MMKQLLQTLREQTSVHSSPNLIDRLSPPRSAVGGTYGADIDRREGEREVSVIPCAYEMINIQDGGRITITSGKAYTVNRSRNGILLLMAYAPTSAQCVEVNMIRSFGRREALVFETRWSRLVYADSEGALYMVGCLRMYGPCRFVEF
ncbi:hypothetical protein [Petrachloros mirabilis]